MHVLVAGWFSFEEGHATAGDLLARDLVCQWLTADGRTFDVAVAPPFSGGVDWRTVDPDAYTHVVFVCGPFQPKRLEAAFLRRFANACLFGIDLSLDAPLDVWNPFDFLIERDTPAGAHADIVFLSDQKQVPVIGVCLVEPHPEARVDEANAAVAQLLASREASVVQIDTRLDVNETGLRTPAEIESLIARVDVLVTTRLHGLVLALKNGVPVLAIDAVPGGAKLLRQAEAIGWPLLFTLDRLAPENLQQALDYCLTEAARDEARAAGERAKRLADTVREGFMAALHEPDSWRPRYEARRTPEGMRAYLEHIAPAQASAPPTEPQPDGAARTLPRGFLSSLLPGRIRRRLQQHRP